MLFIFGIGSKTKVIEKNRFHCPICLQSSEYELRQQRQYFSLFFIPLIPLSKAKNTQLRCLNCGTNMPSHVLQHARHN